MAHDVETMAYRFRDRSDTPWHGLGTPVVSEATPREMLVQSGLDWTVSKRPIFTSTQDFSLPTAEFLALGPDNLMSVPDYFALVRNSDNKILGPCGKEYVPTQNLQAFDFFKNFCNAGRMSMETAGSLQGGRQVWVLAKIEKSFKLAGDDEVGGYVLLSSPHVWGKSLVIKFVAIRVVCANTLAMAMSEGGKSFRMPHVRSFDAAVHEEAKATLGISERLLLEFESKATKLCSAKIDSDFQVKYIADVFQPELIVDGYGKNFYNLPAKKQVEILLDPSVKIDGSKLKRTGGDALSCINRSPGADLESAKNTLWGAFNGVSYYVDHRAGRDRDNALFASWFGPKAATKAKALDRALDFAEAMAA